MMIHLLAGIFFMFIGAYNFYLYWKHNGSLIFTKDSPSVNVCMSKSADGTRHWVKVEANDHHDANSLPKAPSES